MALAKASITPEKGEKIEVHFNPSQYSLDQSNQIAETPIPGLDAPILQYVRGGGSVLSMELLFDTYEQGTDVRKVYTDKIYELLEIVPSTHAPPICLFQWRDFHYRCMVERVNGRFTMFLEDGTPVRATLQVIFKRHISVDILVRKAPTQSADHTKTYTVQRGDTLSSIAAAEYNDPGQWRPIARANRIANPLGLRPGMVLVIPPLL